MTSEITSVPTTRGVPERDGTNGDATTDRSVFHRRESAVRSYCRGFDAVLVSARGSILRDVEGREYLDFLAGAGSLNYGHNDPDMKAALLRYVQDDGIAHSLDLYTAAKREFLTEFEERVLTPRGLEHRVQFCGPTGANAVEAALKLARKVTGRGTVIAFTRAYHGLSLGALAATGNAAMRMGPALHHGGVARMPFDGYLGDGAGGNGLDTAELLAAMLADPSSGLDAPAAILLETVQGEGGLSVAGVPWLRRVAALAKAHGALLIVDDIQAGCGRTGTFFSFEPAGIVPDIVVLSKSLSGFGLPLSVLLVRPEVDTWSPGQHTGTFRGNAHAFVTAAVALRKFWSDDALMVDVARRAALVTDRLSEIARSVPGARVRGRGMMQGLALAPGDAGAVARACGRNGLLIECAGPHDEVVKVLAPLTTPDGQLERGLEILADAVAAVTGAERGLVGARR